MYKGQPNDLYWPSISRRIYIGRQFLGGFTLAINFTASILLAGLFLADPGTDVPVKETHVLRAETGSSIAGRMETLYTLSRQEFQVYVTGSQDAERGLLLVHEWWGLTEHLKVEADYWASRGFRVFAPDLYDGRIPRTSRAAARIMQAIDQPLANSKMGAVLDVMAQAGIQAFALGWCFGGGQVLQGGIAYPDRLQAIAIYYGRPELRESRLARLRSPVLGIWAVQDGWITPQRVESFAKALAKAGREYEFHHFDAGHAFANPSGDHYDSALAREARRLTEDFFDRALR